MATYTKFQDFVGSLGLGEHNLNTDLLKVYLTNATPSVSADVDKVDLAEISQSPENGYTTGGVDITNTYSQTGGTGTCGATDVVITASGGTIGPFRYAVIYNDTHTTDALICYYDYGSSITLNDGESLTVDFTNLFTLT